MDFNQDITRTRFTNNRKPPIGGSSNWQQSVPSWEKKFCTSVGSIPWKKFMETKKFIHLYENILKWNDSAGEEAFQNAKNRYFANFHGLSCDIKLPDPDIYIDKIDWNSPLDSNLILDLDSDFVAHDANKNDEKVVIFGNDFPISYQNFSPYGWGDSDDDVKKDANQGGVVDNNDSWWGLSEIENKAMEGQEWGGKMYENSRNFYGDMNNGSRRYMSRYKTSRFRGDESQRSQTWRNNGNWRKSTAPRMWKSTYSCTPVNSYSPGRGADRWNLEKPVS